MDTLQIDKTDNVPWSEWFSASSKLPWKLLSLGDHSANANLLSSNSVLNDGSCSRQAQYRKRRKPDDSAWNHEMHLLLWLYKQLTCRWRTVGAKLQALNCSSSNNLKLAAICARIAGACLWLRPSNSRNTILGTTTFKSSVPPKLNELQHMLTLCTQLLAFISVRQRVVKLRACISNAYMLLSWRNDAMQIIRVGR